MMCVQSIDQPVSTCPADLARRLQAAAAGERYDEGSESEDAEISDVSPGIAAEGGEDVDIMNSPEQSSREYGELQPWARQVSCSLLFTVHQCGPSQITV